MSALLRLVRRAAQLPGLRALTRVGAVTRVTFALRGALVAESLRFALNELRRSSEPAVYRLRGSDVRVAIRHGTPDVLVLDEIFSQREYELPVVVADALAPPLRVVDVGANVGLFGAFIRTRFPGAEIIAIEADPVNAAAHERTIAANGNGAWRLVQAYAAANERDVRLGGGFSTAAASDQGAAVRSIDVFPLLAEADLVKIDIEGAEWELLDDPRFATLPARAIVLEHHADGCPDPEPRAAAERRLRAAGFEVVAAAQRERYGTGVLWGWRATASASRSTAR